MRRLSDPDELVDAVIDRVGRTIVLGLPLGLGKANHLANALYRRAARDPSIDLTIYTALSLDPPQGGEDLAGRFAGPIAERLYAGVTRLDYVAARRRGELPENVRVIEFFLQAGSLLSNEAAQQNYVTANYSHACRYVLQAGINVLGQMVAIDGNGSRVSLSSNTDMTLDLIGDIEAARDRGEAFALVGEVNGSLPYMPGRAELDAESFDFLLDSESISLARLFSVPKQPLSARDHAIGLYCAALVKDGGTLQIGIGNLGDAITNALILRHRHPATFKACLDALGGIPASIEPQTGPFEEGLYGLSEMFVDGFLELYEASILKREAHDGSVLHAGFFVGSESFYERLRAMPRDRRAKLSMRKISFVNDIPPEDHAVHVTDRRDARFFNAAMMATALGDICSDQLEDGRVVSGVGGQYNFVAQAFRLPKARAVLCLPATRDAGTQSNIRWSYGHTTVPRHLKDIVVTEYGIADLHGRSDAETIAAMIAITDARHQAPLLDAARRSKKIGPGVMPNPANTPERLNEALRPFSAALPDLPFGSDLTKDEVRLVPALKHLKEVSNHRLDLLKLILAGFRATPDNGEGRALQRMGLAEPGAFKDRVARFALLGALRATSR